MHNVRFSEQHGYMIILCKAPLAQCLTLSKSSINAKKKKKIAIFQLFSHVWLCNPMECSPSFTCPSPSPRVSSNSSPMSQLCHPTISSSVISFCSYFQSFSALGPFPMSQLFASGDQSIGASPSVLSMNSQDWFPLGLTCLIALQSKGLARVFSNTAVQKHQFFSA